MNIVIITHPIATESFSMPRYATMISEGMKKRGHEVQCWTVNRRFFSKISFFGKFVQKWLGYIDQYLIYSLLLMRFVSKQSQDTIFICTDQALGIWVPRFVHRPHVIHVVDLLALMSSLGEFTENPTSFTGVWYQNIIKSGFIKGKNFVSISAKTKKDLHRFLTKKPSLSEVVYLGLNFPFRPLEKENAKKILKNNAPEFSFSPIIHIGGNYWYKNRIGVLEIYKEYLSQTSHPHPLWMIGEPPTEEMLELSQSITTSGDIRFLQKMTNEEVMAAYSIAATLLFPSLEEGFGWPIAEAMACGCPVITTNRAPMTEVGGDAAFYIARKPSESVDGVNSWRKTSAKVLNMVCTLNQDERLARVSLGLRNAERFATEVALDSYERIYEKVLSEGSL